MSARCLLLLGVLLSLGCGATVDPLGRDSVDASVEPAFDSDSLRPLSGPEKYPSPFLELLGKSALEIDAKLSSAFQRLFHGDLATQAVYFTVGDDQAFIQDIWHGDVRSEGLGLGMLIAVELDRRDEFDKLWRFARSSLRYATGPNRGYFRSTCSGGPCADPYGQQELAMALLFAHGRWGSRNGDIDYGSEALRTLHVMWHKERENGGVVDDVTNMFDEASALPVDEPTLDRALWARPENVKPGYYALWAQATSEQEWDRATTAGRRFLQSAADTKTGLLPMRANFDGTPEPGADTFVPESYRSQLNMTLDYVFHAAEPWYVIESDRLLSFFAGQGLTSYGASYQVGGSACIDCLHPLALVAMNGVSALPATSSDRKAFVDAVWNAEPVDGETRYYDDLLHLLALLTLSGQLRVY